MGWDWNVEDFSRKGPRGRKTRRTKKTKRPLQGPKHDPLPLEGQEEGLAAGLELSWREKGRLQASSKAKSKRKQGKLRRARDSKVRVINYAILRPYSNSSGAF